MKDKFIHVCFIIDESGSMYGSINDVLGGFNKVIEEQKSVKEGTCSVSLYKFNNTVTESYLGSDINTIGRLAYSPGGSTAMLDGIGTAIDKVGKWLSDMPEEERPEKNLIVIMTDGEENASSEYTASRIKEMIKEQEEKYNWSFVYMGTDITTTKYADSIGIKNQAYTTRKKLDNNYSFVNEIASGFRSSYYSACDVNACIEAAVSNLNEDYKKDTGLDMKLKNIK